MTDESIKLPKNFRKLPIQERREALKRATKTSDDDMAASLTNKTVLDLSDAMIESAIGTMPVPLGITEGFLIDGCNYSIPMATEEPSVIAAASFAGSIIKHHGGFRTWATEPLMTAQIYLENVESGRESLVDEKQDRLIELVEEGMEGLKARGGGSRRIEYSWIPGLDVLRVHINIDVRDAMGANIVNSAAERVKGELEKITGGDCLMCVVTNDAKNRRAGAEFRIPVHGITRGIPTELPGDEVARRIVLASAVAQEDSSRAVTHNKGIMNGISALALATGNDVRGIEAGVHHWACKENNYRGLTAYEISEGYLIGKTDLPLPFATVGGAVTFHPVSKMCLKLLGNPDSMKLSRIAASLGLAQNFAALLALVTEGIQKGHMRLHAERIAYQAGARNTEVKTLADMVTQRRIYRIDAAKRILSEIRKESST